jgi:hypothetical protein
MVTDGKEKKNLHSHSDAIDKLKLTQPLRSLLRGVLMARGIIPVFKAFSQQAHYFFHFLEAPA